MNNDWKDWSAQNGSGIHTITDNNVDIPTISLKYEDSCTSTPTVNGNDLARNIFMILSHTGLSIFFKCTSTSLFTVSTFKKIEQLS